MKIEEIAQPGVIALGVVGIAATALLGFAAGAAVARDPEVLRRTVRRVARSLERATLVVAQAREHVGDLWAEAREDAIAEVDAADFKRAASSAAKPAPAAAAPATPVKAARKRAASPRKGRKSTAPVTPTTSKDTDGQE
jgi:hypothetical protein